MLIAQFALSALGCLLAVLSTIFPASAKPVALTGACIALLVVAIGFQRERCISRAVEAQDAFDRCLYGLVSIDTVIEVATKLDFKRQAKTNPYTFDWYSDVRGLPLEYASILCQRENVVWDTALRRRFIALLVASLVAWVSTGLIISFATNASVRDYTFTWLVPSVSFIGLSATTLQRNIRVLADKQKIAQNIQDQIASLASLGGPRVPLDADALRPAVMVFQERITASRKNGRVPYFLFARNRDRDRDLSRISTANIKRRLQP